MSLTDLDRFATACVFPGKLQALDRGGQPSCGAKPSSATFRTNWGACADAPSMEMGAFRKWNHPGPRQSQDWSPFWRVRKW